MDQNQIFKSGEADGWYERNRVSLDQMLHAPDTSIDVSELCANLSPFFSQIGFVLEIGCSSGIKLEAICTQLGASGAGLEPSQLAVHEGNKRLQGSNIILTCGTAEKLPYSSGSFDLVYFGFCLYLFDRTSLLSALAEADRVLRPGGFLAITDFDPGINNKRHYTHREYVFSYKQNYASIYMESGMYYLMSKKSFSHRNPFFDLSSDERISLSILYKEIDPYPLVKP